MRIKCFSVRLESLVSISDKAYRVTCFDGSSDIIPKSQVFGPDLEVSKSDAWWISEWILAKKNLQYSRKKAAVFDERGRMLPDMEITHHKPQRIVPKENKIINELKK